jgi:hypothetical protein
MNKKLIALLIPLLLLPLFAYGYAHWTDSIVKKYKFRFGTVQVEVVKWHIDDVKAWDANSNGIIFGEEVNVTEVLDNDGELIGFEISADPVGPGFSINFTMLIHNKGRLPYEVYAPEINVSDLTSDDPDFTDFTPLPALPPWMTYTFDYLANQDLTAHNDFNASHYTQHVEPTELVYEPSQCLKITQKIDFFIQAYPELQCHYFRIFVQIPVRNSNPADYQSYHNVTRGWP